MANHLHRQIREALETALTGLTTTTTHAYANRLQPMMDANLPGLRIYLDEEESQPLTVHQPMVQERTLSLVVECCAKAVANLDDTLDLISQEVEIALSSGITIGGKNLTLVYGGMSFADDQSDKPVGIKRLRFAVMFNSLSNAPDVLI
jgi:hypothetical protein